MSCEPSYFFPFPFFRRSPGDTTPALTHTTFRGQCHRLRGGRSRQVFSFARNSFSLDGTFFVFWISSLSFGRHAVTFSSRPFSTFPLSYVFAFFSLKFFFYQSLLISIIIIHYFQAHISVRHTCTFKPTLLSPATY